MKRPPVRFLFDVINAVDVVAGMSLFRFEGEDEEKGEKGRSYRDWSFVGASKESKVSFMDTVRLYSIFICDDSYVFCVCTKNFSILHIF